LKIEILIKTQVLDLYLAGQFQRSYRISTARNGSGQLMNSECTPLGHHYIRAKIGDAAASGSVFVGRRWTGETYHSDLRQRYPQRDWILTRILWLCGREPGLNRLGDVDTMRRYVYIHGAPEDDPIGVPGSRGCIKMRNTDIIELFERVSVGCPVEIRES